jgi:hypothetical protein
MKAHGPVSVAPHNWMRIQLRRARIASRRSVAAFWRAPPGSSREPRAALAVATRFLRCLVQLAPSARPVVTVGRGPRLPESPAYVEPKPQGHRILLHSDDASRERPRRTGRAEFNRAPEGGENEVEEFLFVSRVRRLEHGAARTNQNSRPPSGTFLSGPSSTTPPSSSGKPSVSTSDIIGPIWRGGKFSTAPTCRPIKSAGL